MPCPQYMADAILCPLPYRRFRPEFLKARGEGSAPQRPRSRSQSATDWDRPSAGQTRRLRDSSARIGFPHTTTMGDDFALSQARNHTCKGFDKTDGGERVCGASPIEGKNALANSSGPGTTCPPAFRLLPSAPAFRLRLKVSMHVSQPFGPSTLRSARFLPLLPLPGLLAIATWLGGSPLR